MKFTITVVLFLFGFCLGFCESIVFECNSSKNGIESIVVYCSSSERVLPINCSPLTFLDATNVNDKSKVKQLKVDGCDHIKQLVEMFSNLQSLDISHSELEVLQPFDLQYLMKINASHNRLTTIPRQFFAMLPNIVELDFSHNNLSEIDELPTNLQKIHLSHNTNLELFNGKFPQSQSHILKNLQEFYAINCKITNASQLTKQFGSSLSHLDLSENDLHTLDDNTFENIPNLHVLRLRDVSLTKFNFETLTNHLELVIIDLSDNQLKSINIAAAPTNLHTIYLNGNELVALEHLTHSNIPRLSYLSIYGNQFTCEYLKTSILTKLKQEWPRLRIIGDSWKQGDGDRCLELVRTLSFGIC